MKQLTGLDASFLYMESAEMPMHVGALHLFELPASYKGSFLADMRKHMATRLAIAPALRRKLAWMPFNLANPVWVDSAPDLAQNIVGVKLPKGSGLPELQEQVGELHPLLLDRTIPLWKFYVFEGLAPGPNKEKRVGLYTKIHHAGVDGQAAVALAQAILDLGPQPRDIEVEQRAPKLKIGMAEMLSGVLANQLQQYANIVKALPSTVGTLSQVARQGAGSVASSTVAKVRGKGKKDDDAGSLGLAPRTRWNATVSPERAFAAVSIPMAELKALRRAHDMTLNDVVLMICSGAMRRHFLQHGPLPRKSLVAAVPVSTRAVGDTSSDNQASMTVVNLGTHIADPLKRLEYVKAACAAMKSTLSNVKSLMPTDFPSLGVPWLMSAVSSLYGKAKVADRIPPFANVTISNVPGPAFPLYMAGAKMLTNYPTSIVVHGVALNITLQSYNQSLEFGIIACARAEPHVTDLAVHVKESFDEMKTLAPTAAPVPVAAAAGAKPAAAKSAKSRAKTVGRPVPKATPQPRASASSAKRVSR
jgi:diacylglycerol O-acyltransferase